MVATLQWLSILTQDMATLVDISGIIGVLGFTGAGCEAGIPRGFWGVVGGCAAGAVGGLTFYNTTPLNAAESILSTTSTGLTLIADYIDDGQLGESSKTSVTITLIGGLMIDPFTDLALDGYASGYNHELFNDIDTIIYGGPLMK